MNEYERPETDAIPSPHPSSTSGEGKVEGVSEGEGSSRSVDSLQADLAAMRDKHLRAAAELENYRKLVIREKADLMRSTQEGVLRAFLPIVDSLERAMHTTGPGRVDGNSQFARAVQEGVELTHRQLQEVLKRLGVVPIESRGRVFDPSFHQAVARVESAGQGDTMVVEELQRGYLFHDRVLRPAMVSVAAPESAESKQSGSETHEENGGIVHG